jgi:hypothetical protein
MVTATSLKAWISERSKPHVPTGSPAKQAGRDFIRDIIAADLERKRAPIVTLSPRAERLSPLAKPRRLPEFRGLRIRWSLPPALDDTNPTGKSRNISTPSTRCALARLRLGQHLYHASDYFEQLYEWAEHLIRAGLAYVDDQSQDEMRATAHADRTSKRKPLSREQWRKISVSSAACAQTEFRAPGAPRQVDMAARTLALTRSRALPHSACEPSAHRHQGRFIRATISPTANRRDRRHHIPSAP